MFYKFNSFSGRLMPATQTEAYSPQGLNPAVCEPSRIIFDSKKTRTASDSSTPVRSSTSSKASSTGKLPAGGVVPTSARYKRIQELQNHFLKNDGRLVWQKMGVRDAVPYWTTIGLCIVGTLVTANLFCDMIFPKKK